MSCRPGPIEAVRCVRRFGPRHGLANVARMLPRHGETRLWISDDRRVIVRRAHSDWETFSEVFLDQCYSDDFVTLFGAVPASGEVRTVVDAGANVGYTSIYFRRRYPNAEVWAIEPDHDNFELLERNTAHDAHIHPVRGALWQSHEPVSIVDGSTASNGIRVAAGGCDGASDVQGYTVPDLIEMVPGNRIDVLKIDIEGAERFVFDEAASRWLERVGLILIELHDWKQPGSSRAFHEALRGVDYDEFVLGGTVGVLVNGPAARR